MNSKLAYNLRPDDSPDDAWPRKSAGDGIPACSPGLLKAGRKSMRAASVTILAGLACLLSLATARAELIPASRLGAWTPGVDVGVVGGVPTNRTNLIDVTRSPYSADRTGSRDCTDALTAAIRAAGNGDVVYLPAGTYRVDRPVIVFDKSNFTIRGEGDATVIMAYCGYPGVFYFGSSVDYLWNYPSSGVPITGGYTKGSTTINVADTSLFSVGQLIQIKESDDISLPVVNLGAKTGSHGATQKATVLAKTSNSLTISPGLYWNLKNGLSPRIYTSRGQADRIGIEDLKIDGSNSTSSYMIWLEQCVNSWIKNVHLAAAYQYVVFVMDCVNVEIRHSNFNASQHTGSNGAGLLVEGTCASLFEDNIFYKQFPHLEMNFGSCGNVFAYNFCEDSTVYGMIGVSIDANHGPHNRLNLYEGNISPLFQSDGYFGSASDDVVFRNWLHGTSPTVTAVREPIILNRFTRNYTIAGNVLGRNGVQLTKSYLLGVPLMGNTSYAGTAQLSAARPWSDWSAYLSGTYTKGTNDGFLELDLDVEATTTIKGNYSVRDAGIPSAETLSEPLPNSLYRTNKPDWFGSLNWPPFNPASPNMTYDAIPAGYRYVHGGERPSNSSGQPPIKVRIEIAE